MKKSNKKFKVFCIIIIVRNHHYFIILKLFQVIKGIYSVSNNANGIKIGLQFSTFDKFTEPAELKNSKLENPSILFWPLAQ